ncbi:hypothetical protein AB0C84_45390 [Actinomadura sp. NPDC048955]|uniref:hypothetical protein n=1 Tax=Actinomadura sp. NPDC048955 TaxID=3158228 RepID=UPI0033E19A92
MIPAASGAILKIGGDYPYTFQGVAAGTSPVADGQPASAGQVYGTVIYEVKGDLQDRPLPAPAPQMVFRWSRCGGLQCQSDPVQRTRAYIPRSQADQSGDAQSADPSEMLSPGDTYLGLVTAEMPQSVDRRRLELCNVSFTSIKDCIPVGTLPPLPKY